MLLLKKGSKFRVGSRKLKVIAVRNDGLLVQGTKKRSGHPFLLPFNELPRKFR